MKTRIVVAFVAALIVQTAVAHHSFAPHFDPKKPMRITGIVTRFDSRNPHVYLYIDAIDENGKHREYVCASHGATQLARVGITPQMLLPGAMVTVTGPQARNDPYMCFFNTVELADGRVLDVDGASAREPAAAPSSR